jgi:ubiquinone/menaquinone biosynthesis C-methylase UbiE
MNREDTVKHRYAAASQAPEAALCCPVEYNNKYLDVIPPEVIEKDYGCGDPSRYLHPGEIVLDLGSGVGKICFIAAQMVGPSGRVIGVDMTDEMLAVARRNAPLVAERLGYANVEFRKGRIQDLGLDLEALDRELKAHTVSDSASFLAANQLADKLRTNQPLVADDSVDVVLSNCVLNLVEPGARQRLFADLFRVLRKGGRAVISDIVSDEEVPADLQKDPKLWSGCIAGAFTETGILDAFIAAGFYGIQILKRNEQPWQTVQGIEFRSVTVQAFKGKQGPCFERNQAVIYLGPFKEVLDDDGNRMERGRRYAVCDKTYQLYKEEPYQSHFAFVDPLRQISPSQAAPFDGSGTRERHPKETKGQQYSITSTDDSCCGRPGSCG